MRLTKYHKEAIIAAIMQDVPKPARDFDEEHRKAVKADMIHVAGQTNPALAKALADKDVFSYLVHCHSSTYPPAVRLEGGGYYSSVEVGINSVATYADYRPSPELKAFQAKLMQEALAVHVEREALEAKITAVINACTTRKTVLERMPEFEKYLPEEPTTGSMLPAVANLAADLVKAGWQKSKVAA